MHFDKIASKLIHCNLSECHRDQHTMLALLAFPYYTGFIYYEIWKENDIKLCQTTQGPD